VAEWDETAEGVLVDVARLTRLVDDLLLLARLDDDRAPARVVAEPADLSALAAAAAQRPGRRVPVALAEAAGGNGPVLVRADEDTVTRILENLLSNADRYAATGVALDVRRVDGSGTLTVTDDGPGIPAGARARVFERFARVDASRSQHSGGSGLGLAIVRELAESYGGTVQLLDAEPGLCAVVTLPLATAATND
jgi:signal transduction histidine kinase